MLKIINSKIFTFLVFFILSLAPLFWYPFSSQEMYIGGGDFISSINISDVIVNRTAVYSSQLYGGIDYSFITAHLFPFLTFYWIFSLVHISPLITTIFFISAILFTAGISMYYFLRYIINTKFNFASSYSNIWMIGGAILYELSPFILLLIHPGHLLLLLSYALFPLILLFYDKLLYAKNGKVGYILALSILFLSCASAFANIGILYTLFLILACYSIFVWIVEGISKKKIFIILLLTVITAILSNLWWMLPYLSSFTATVSLNMSSAKGITEGIGDASKMASVQNILLGKPDVLQYVSSKLYMYIGSGMLILFLFLFLLFIYTLPRVRKYSYLLILLGMLIIGVFISKGEQPPLTWIFSLMYEYVPGFQIFRRPVSKFYWEFLFFYFSFITIGFFIVESRVRTHINIIRTFIMGFIIFSSFLLFASFVKSPAFITFSIPQLYFEAGKYMKEDGVSRVLLLPNIDGQHPRYDRSVNNYEGADFLPYIWDYTQIQPDMTSYSPELPYKKVTKDLYISILQNKSYCSQTKGLGLSHIVLRSDLLNKVRKNESVSKIAKILDASEEVKAKREFKYNNNVSLIVYTLKDSCRGNLLSLNSHEGSSIDSFQYRYMSDASIILQIPPGERSHDLQYLVNYSPAWKLYEINDYNTFSSKDEFSLLFKHPIFDNTHVIANDYANKWSIPSEVNRSQSYVLYYQPKMYFLLGVIVTCLYFIILGGLYLVSRRKKE